MDYFIFISRYFCEQVPVMEGFHAFGSVDLLRLPYSLRLFEFVFCLEPEKIVLHFYELFGHLLRDYSDSFWTGLLSIGNH